jgi:hypothetical protein
MVVMKHETFHECTQPDADNFSDRNQEPSVHLFTQEPQKTTAAPEIVRLPVNCLKPTSAIFDIWAAHFPATWGSSVRTRAV